MKELKETIKHDPTNSMAVQFMAGQYYQDENYEKAIESYKMLMSIDPKHKQRAYYFIGASYVRLGDYSNAEIYLNKALEDNPSDDESLYTLGLVYKAQGNMDGALKIYEKLKKMNSSYADRLTH